MKSLVQVYKYAGDSNTSVYLNAVLLGIVPQGNVQYGLDKNGKMTITLIDDREQMDTVDEE